MDIESIFVYLVTFFSSCVFIHISQLMLYDKLKNKNKNVKFRILGFIFLSIGILIPCVLAALRGLKVGMDMGYVVPNIMGGSSLSEHGFWGYFNNMPVDTEIGFAYLMYIGNVYRSFGLPFFIIQLLIIVPIYFMLTKYRNKLSVTLGMLVYYFLFYNLSLCIIRGSVAMSVMPLVFYYIKQRKYLKSILLLLYALSFHNSALFVFVVGLYIHFIMTAKNKKKWICFTVILVISMFSVVTKFSSLFINIIGLINLRYAGYMNNYLGYGSSSNVPMTDFLSKVLLILLVTLILMKTKKFDKESQYLCMFAIFGRIFTLFNSVFYESMRFAFYFDIFIVFYASSMYYCFRNTILNKCAAFVMTLFPPFFYWLYFMMYIGAYQTNIYTIR